MKGYVYLTEHDLERIAEFLGMTPRAFEAKYVYRTKNYRRLRKPPRSQCHFLAPDGCRVHPVKPAQCRLFPFWPEVVGSRQGLEEAAAYCPGIGRGPLIESETAIRMANEMREAYPPMYEDE